MADRIVVQETCSNGRLHPLEWEEPASCCDHWPNGDRSHPLYGLCPTASFCDGAVRRVLDPNSYVRYMGEWDGCLPIYDQLPVVTRAALAHLHGRHDEPTAYCPLCGFFEDESALDALAGGDS